MRIRLLDIKGFGKFNEKCIRPSDGFNLITGPNESGKSTLVDFVTAMLYGLGNGKRSRKSQAGPGKAYKPWSGSSFAGVMEYVLDDGSAYRVDRHFDKGLTHIRDGMSRDITAQFALSRETGPRFAEAQLGLSEEVFIRSAQIRQMQSAMDPNGARIILEKLANLSTSGSEDLSLSRALAALENALLERVGTDRSTTRPLDRVEARLQELQQMRTELLEQHERYLDAWSMLKQEEERLQELRQRHDELKARHHAQLKDRLDALSRECGDLDRSLAEMKAALADLEKRLDESGVFGEMTEKAMETLNNTWHEYEETQKQLGEWKSRIKALEQEYGVLNLQLERLQPLKERVERTDQFLKEQEGETRKPESDAGRGRKRGPQIPLLIPALFMLAAGVILVLPAILSLDRGMPLYAAAGASALIGILTAVFRGKNGKAVTVSPADQQMSFLLKEGFSGINDYLSQKEELQSVLTAYETKRREFAEAQKMRDPLMRKRDALFKTLASYLDGFGSGPVDPESVESAMEAFRNEFRRFREDDSRAHELRQRIEALEEKRGLLLREAGALTRTDIASSAELKAIAARMTQSNALTAQPADGCGNVSEKQIRAIEEDIKNCEIRISSLNVRLENAPSQEELAKIEDEILRLREKKYELDLAGRTLRTARDILKEVGSRLQMNYTSELNVEMGRYLSLITHGRYHRIKTDPEGRLYLEVPECEELVPVSRLSSGTIDQVYFSMRLAALALMERGGETIPLFLDEPFLQYDEERTLQAFKLLREASADRQVFFMTSRRRELELARELWGDALNVIEL